MSTKKVPARVTILCDRCKADLHPLSFVGIRAKGSRGYRGLDGATGGGSWSLDLCERCAAEFDDWLRSSRRAGDGVAEPGIEAGEVARGA